jgi:hypothetical protein
LGYTNQPLTEEGERMDAFILVNRMKYNSLARRAAQWFVNNKGITAF